MFHMPNRESYEHGHHHISAFYGYLFRGKDVSVSYNHKSPPVKSHGTAQSFARCQILFPCFVLFLCNSASFNSTTTPFQGADSNLASYLTTISPLMLIPAVQHSRLLALRSRSTLSVCFMRKPSLKMILTFIIVHLKWLWMNVRNSTFGGVFQALKWTPVFLHSVAKYGHVDSFRLTNVPEDGTVMPKCVFELIFQNTAPILSKWQLKFAVPAYFCFSGRWSHQSLNLFGVYLGNSSLYWISPRHIYCWGSNTEPWQYDSEHLTAQSSRKFVYFLWKLMALPSPVADKSKTIKITSCRRRRFKLSLLLRKLL